MLHAALSLGAGLQAPAPLSQRSSRFAGSRTALKVPARVSHRRLQSVAAQNNELNKWADRSNYDEGGDDLSEWAAYDKETANIVLRVLTAKATQRLLLQLQELDLHKAQWLNNYCSAHPPSEGNKFLLELMRQPASVVTDTNTGTDHKIEPANLAHRVIQIRSSMADTMAKFPRFVELENADVMRRHLTSSTFVSGTGGRERGYETRRGYNRPRSSH